MTEEGEETSGAHMATAAKIVIAWINIACIIFGIKYDAKIGWGGGENLLSVEKVITFDKPPVEGWGGEAPSWNEEGGKAQNIRNVVSNHENLCNFAYWHTLSESQTLYAQISLKS